MTGILRVTQRLELAHEKIVVVVFAIEHRRVFTTAVGGTAHGGVVGFPGEGELRDAQRITEIAGSAAEHLCSVIRFAAGEELVANGGILLCEMAQRREGILQIYGSSPRFLLHQ